jgi:hypothetical protein
MSRRGIDVPLVAVMPVMPVMQMMPGMPDDGACAWL